MEKNIESHFIFSEDSNNSTGHFGSGTNIFITSNKVYIIKQAETATGPSSIFSISNDNSNKVEYLKDELQIPQEVKIEYLTINLQLNYWIDAKKLFREITSSGHMPTYSEFDKIILFLITSLSKLFGRNWKNQDRVVYNQKAKEYNESRNKGNRKLKYFPENSTPSLIDFIRDCYPMSKTNWSLQDDDPALYKRFEKMAFFFNENVKHYEDTKEPNIFSITIDNIKDFMDITQEIWKWYLNKYYKNDVPKELLKEFSEMF